MIWIITGTSLRHDIFRHCVNGPFFQGAKHIELEYDMEQEIPVVKTKANRYVPLEPRMLQNIEIISASPMILTTPFYKKLSIVNNSPVKTIAIVEQILKESAPEKEHRDKKLCRELENRLKEINSGCPPIMNLATITSEQHWRGYIMEEDCIADLTSLVIKIADAIISVASLVNHRIPLLSPWELYLFEKKYGMDNLHPADICYTIAGNQPAFEELMDTTQKRAEQKEKTSCSDNSEQDVSGQIQEQTSNACP